MSLSLSLSLYLQVSWIRKRDLHILTAGILTYTSDERFKVRIRNLLISPAARQVCLLLPPRSALSVRPSGLLNGHEACLAICKPSQLNCVCNSPPLAPGALPARPTKLPTCMHWLNLRKDTRTQLPNAASVSVSVSASAGSTQLSLSFSLYDLSLHFACRSYAPPTPRIGRCMWNMRSHVTAASTSAKWIRSRRFRWHSAWMS